MAVLCATGARAGAQSGSVAGVVRDSRGAPQPGAEVELLRPNLSIIKRVYTDDHGRYRIGMIGPGVYEVEASGAFFLPTMRENLRMMAGSVEVVNLTLDTLYQAFRWLPAQPRTAEEPSDDWSWTLRLSANRPLLRMLQNGPLVVVTDGKGSQPTLKARVTVRGGESGFGDGGIHNDFEMERAPDDGKAMILRADLSQGEAPALNAMAGYEQQLAPGHTFRTVALVEDQPDIAGGPGMQGMQAMEMRSGQTLSFGSVQLEAGDNAELVHLGGTLMANHPFASLTVTHGDTVVVYRMSTAPGIQSVNDLDREATSEPELTEWNNTLQMEQGLRQQMSVEHSHGDLRVKVTAWQEHVEHPVVNGGGEIAPADWSQGDLLYDGSTNLLQASGQSFSGDGLMSEVDEQVGGNTWISFDVAVGDALRMAEAAPDSQTVAQALNDMRAAEMPMYSAAVRGKLARTGTQWQASYRWQSPQTVTAVDAFASGAADPYLSLLVRQPIRVARMPNGVEALVDVRNLLAEGYRPFLSRDGSTLYFAQAARCVEGGLSFSF